MKFHSVKIFILLILNETTNIHLTLECKRPFDLNQKNLQMIYGNKLSLSIILILSGTCVRSSHFPKYLLLHRLEEPFLIIAKRMDQTAIVLQIGN